MEKHFDIEKHLREDLELLSPTPDFSKKVMGAIAGARIAPPSRTYINKKVVYGIGLFFLLLIAGGLVYAASSFSWPAMGRFILPVDPGKLDISNYFTRKTLNSLLFLNVLLGLGFLDKYLTRRPRRQHLY
jgi:hypothetical protein